MTEFSTNGAGLHKAGSLRVSRGGSVTEGAYVLWALGADVLGRLALEAPYHGWGGWFGVRDDNGVVAGSRLHNHLQSSGECNTSSAHSRSTSSVNPSPALLSQHSIMMISFPCGKGGCSGMMGEGVGPLGHLGRRVNSHVSGGQGFGRRGGLGRGWRAWVDSVVGGWSSILLVILHCSLHWTIGPVICSLLLLQE